MDFHSIDIKISTVLPKIQSVWATPVQAKATSFSKMCAAVCGSRNIGIDSRACNTFYFATDRNICITGFIPLVEAVEMIMGDHGNQNETLFLDKAVWDINFI